MQEEQSTFEERTIETRREFAGNLLKLRVDTVKLPDGRVSQREIVEHPGAVAIVPVTSDNEVLLVRQWRHPIRQVTLEIPAGCLEAGEEPERTAQRELVEETGYFPGALEKLTSLYLSVGYSDEIIHIFLARNLQKTGEHDIPGANSDWQADDDENLQTVRMPLEEAIQKARSGEMVDSKTVAGLLLAWRQLASQ